MLEGQLEQFLNITIATCISSENNKNNDDRCTNIKSFHLLLMKIEQTDELTEEEKKYYTSICADSIKALEKEIQSDNQKRNS